MSGHVPEWIFRGATVFFGDKPREVEDYFFTAGTPGLHNDDTIVVRLRGVKKPVVGLLGLSPRPNDAFFVGNHGRAYLKKGHRKNSVMLGVVLGSNNPLLDITGIPKSDRAQFCNAFEAILLDAERRAHMEGRKDYKNSFPHHLSLPPLIRV